MSELRRIVLSDRVLTVTGYSPMHLSRLEKQGRFPKRFKLANEAKNGRVAWWEDEIQQWLEQRGRAREQRPQCVAS